MGFWSKLGKGLLKVGKVAAPVALGLTGVGLPAVMAVSGGLNALDKKVSGGSWTDALLSGGIGAGTAAIGGGALNALKGGAGAATTTAAIPSLRATTGLSGLFGEAGKQSFGSVLKGALTNGDTLASLGKVVSGAAQGSADDRAAQDAFNLNRYQLERSAYDKDMDYAVNLPPALMKQVRDADITLNTRNNVSGLFGAKSTDELNRAASVASYRPSADATRAQEEVRARALANLFGGPGSTLPTRPVIPDQQKAGTAENILGGAGTALSIFGALRGANTAPVPSRYGNQYGYRG